MAAQESPLDDALKEILSIAKQQGWPPLPEPLVQTELDVSPALIVSTISTGGRDADA